MKLLFTALVIVVVGFGVVQFANAAYGWFQVSGVVEDQVANELPRIVERIQPASITWDVGTDRYVKLRENII